jgi:hypothetical protein
MKRTLLFAVLSMTLGAYAVLPQEDFAAASVNNLRHFVQFEIAGGRLTDDGWRTANKRFFLNTRGITPEPPPKDRNILVVSDKFNVRLESLAPTGTATVETSFSMCYGRVDPQLQFSFMDAGIPRGVAVSVVCASTFDMVASGIVKAHIGPKPDTIMLDRAAAIRYVAEKREQARDPDIRKNADAALAALKKLKPY